MHLLNKNGDYMLEGGAWFGRDDDHNVSTNVPEHLAAPGAGEIGALLTTMSTLSKNAPLHVVIKSSKL